MKKEISTNKAPKALGPYSQGIIINDLIFTSGQIGINPETGDMANGIKDQTVQVFENLKGILNEANVGFDNVIKAVVYIKNIDDFGTVNEIYNNYFNKPYPARTTVEISKLPKNALIEIEVIATKNINK